MVKFTETHSTEYDYKKALDDLTEIIENGFATTYTYLSRGTIYFLAGESKKAIDDFANVIEQDIEASIKEDFYSMRGTVHYSEGNYKEAIDDFTRKIDMSQNSPLISNYTLAHSYRYRCLAYYSQKDYENGTNDYKKILEFKEKIDIYFFIKNFIQRKTSEGIFEILNNSEVIWENEPVYKDIVKKYSKTIYKKKSEEFKKLWFYQCVLLYVLSLKNDSNTDIATYCDINTLKILLNIGNFEKPNKLRLTSLSEVNDIEEGNVLLKLLEKECKFTCKKEDIKSKFMPVQKSFTRNKNSLTMFRLYGKNGNKEAAGACLVFYKSFFNTNDDARMPFYKDVERMVNTDNNLDNDVTEQELKEQNQKLPLYYVLYYDKKTNQFIYNPTNSEHENVIIDLDSNNATDCKIPNRAFDKKRTTENVQFIFKEIFRLIKEITTEGENSKKEIEIIYTLLINIHYLVKDVAFVAESELRLLDIISPDDKNLKDDFNTNKSYKDYSLIIDKDNNICHIEEVILGKKAENSTWLKGALEKLFNKEEYENCGKVNVSVSKLPLR